MWPGLCYVCRFINNHFYSHISARCDQTRLPEIKWWHSFLLSHLCEMWQKLWIYSSWNFWFLLSHLCEMWRKVFGILFLPENFYSHISARCDDISIMERCSFLISTLTSLRDVTQKFLKLLQKKLISTLTSLRDVTIFSFQGSRIFQFLLSHLCEMWPLEDDRW